MKNDLNPYDVGLSPVVINKPGFQSSGVDPRRLRQVLGQNSEFGGIQKLAIHAIMDVKIPIVVVMETEGSEGSLLMMPESYAPAERNYYRYNSIGCVTTEFKKGVATVWALDVSNELIKGHRTRQEWCW